MPYRTASLFTMRHQPEWLPRARLIFSDQTRYHGSRYLNVERDPMNPDFYLRRFWLGNAAISVGLKPREYLEVSEKHFSVLEQAGVRIPPREHYVDGAGLLDRKRNAVAYTATPAIEGEALPVSGETDTSNILPGLVRALDAYYRWTKEEDDGLYLGGIVYTKRYLYGRKAEDTSDSVYLVSSSPNLMDTGNKTDMDFMRAEAEYFQGLAESVGIQLPDNPVLRKP